MNNPHVTDEQRGPFTWLFLVALLLALPVVGVATSSALAGDDEPAADTATAEAESAEDEPAEEEKAHLPWMMDVAAAKKQAADEGKDLFINFTGSDWCGWCKRLDAEVFEHAAFVDAATKDYVFLFLDFPNAPELKDKVVDAELNKKLYEDYGVQGYPTIILAKADGTPYGRTRYQEGGPEAYLEHLAGFQAGSDALGKLLADKTDVEALKAALPILVENKFLGWPTLAWTLDAAEKADPKGDLGLLDIVKAERQRIVAETEWKEFAKLLPQRRGEELDLEKVVPAALALEHQAGPQLAGIMTHLATMLARQGDAEQAGLLIDKGLPALETMKDAGGPQYLQATINMSMALVFAERAEEAKTMIDAIADDPFFTEQPRAQQVLDQVRAQIDQALAGDDDAGEEHDGDDDEGHDDDEDGDAHE